MPCLHLDRFYMCYGQFVAREELFQIFKRPDVITNFESLIMAVDYYDYIADHTSETTFLKRGRYANCLTSAALFELWTTWIAVHARRLSRTNPDTTTYQIVDVRCIAHRVLTALHRAEYHRQSWQFFDVLVWGIKILCNVKIAADLMGYR